MKPSTQHVDSRLQPPAVVVGACGHGLALVRALHGGGVPVHVLEANPALPGARTRLARVHIVPSIHGVGLVDALLALHKALRIEKPPVLFLTNDAMVRTVGANWAALAGHFALSWADCRDRLTPLLDKPALEARCAEAGVAYPYTFVLRHPDDAPAAARAIGFPMIAKPARPLSGFKTALPDSLAALQALVAKQAADLPFLVQRFVPGDDRAIHFCALYLDRGREIARFDGHKLRSRPMGHTSIAEGLVDDAVHEQTRRFFDGLKLSGPVSLELKRDPEGRLWVIEPTVGRTDFWIGLCIENGVNLPLAEYRHQTGQSPLAMPQRDEAVWFNEDRDPGGRWWLAGSAPPSLGRRRAAFVFLHRNDPWPALAFVAQAGRYYGAAPARRMRRVLALSRDGAGANPLAATRVWPDWAALQRDLAQDGSRPSVGSLFQTPEWFEVLDRSCAASGARTALVGLQQGDSPLVLPLRLRPGGHAESLSNYYAAYFGPIGETAGADTVPAAALARWMRDAGLSTLRLHAVDPDAPFWRGLAAALRNEGYWVDRYAAFGNWYQPSAGLRWADYLAARPSRLRNTILRTQRKLGRDPAYRLQVLGPDAAPATMEAAVAAFKHVYAHSWKKPEPYPSFIDNLCRMAHAKGWLRLGLCEWDGEPVSAQIWLVHGGVASIFKLAYDERHARRGVGTAVSAAMWQHVLDVDHVDEVDFLAGDDAYKIEWMSARRQRYGLVAFQAGRPRGLLAAALHFGGHAMRRWVRRATPPTTR